MPYTTEDGFFEIPFMTDPVAQSATVTCLKCGIPIRNAQNVMEIHKRFHEDIDELIDWARSVSQLFKKVDNAEGS